MATPTLSKHLYQDSRAVRSGPATGFGQVSEWFWFCLSFILFIILGPFSAPVALIVLARLGMEENSCQEPESITTL